MPRNRPNGHSLSEAVRKEINSLPHTKTSLGEGIVNYSALARKLMPALNEKLNKKVNEESIIVAIKRYADELEEGTTSLTYIDIFSNAQVLLQDNMCYAHFKKTEKVVKKLDELFATENWNVGEVRVLIHGADQVMTIMKESRMRELLNELKDESMFVQQESSLLTLTLPFDSFYAYGVIAEITALLAKKGISIELLSSPPDLHFLVDEKDAERAYSTIKQLIRESKTMVKEKEK